MSTPPSKAPALIFGAIAVVGVVLLVLSGSLRAPANNAPAVEVEESNERQNEGLGVAPLDRATTRNHGLDTPASSGEQPLPMSLPIVVDGIVVDAATLVAVPATIVVIEEERASQIGQTGPHGQFTVECAAQSVLEFRALHYDSKRVSLVDEYDSNASRLEDLRIGLTSQQWLQVSVTDEAGVAIPGQEVHWTQATERLSRDTAETLVSVTSFTDDAGTARIRSSRSMLALLPPIAETASPCVLVRPNQRPAAKIVSSGSHVRVTVCTKDGTPWAGMPFWVSYSGHNTVPQRITTDAGGRLSVRDVSSGFSLSRSGPSSPFASSQSQDWRVVSATRLAWDRPHTPGSPSKFCETNVVVPSRGGQLVCIDAETGNEVREGVQFALQSRLRDGSWDESELRTLTRAKSCFLLDTLSTDRMQSMCDARLIVFADGYKPFIQPLPIHALSAGETPLVVSLEPSVSRAVVFPGVPDREFLRLLRLVDLETNLLLPVSPTEGRPAGFSFTWPGGDIVIKARASQFDLFGVTGETLARISGRALAESDIVSVTLAFESNEVEVSGVPSTTLPLFALTDVGSVWPARTESPGTAVIQTQFGDSCLVGPEQLVREAASCPFEWSERNGVVVLDKERVSVEYDDRWCLDDEVVTRIGVKGAPSTTIQVAAIYTRGARQLGATDLDYLRFDMERGGAVVGQGEPMPEIMVVLATVRVAEMDFSIVIDSVEPGSSLEIQCTDVELVPSIDILSRLPGIVDVEFVATPGGDKADLLGRSMRAESFSFHARWSTESRLLLRDVPIQVDLVRVSIGGLTREFSIPEVESGVRTVELNW